MGQVLSLADHWSVFSSDQTRVYSKVELGLFLKSFGRHRGGSFNIPFNAPASIFFWSTEELVSLLKMLAPRVMWEQMVIFALPEESRIEVINPETDLICGRIMIRREIPSGQVEPSENVIFLKKGE
jgi:hypothetical protein